MCHSQRTACRNHLSPLFESRLNSDKLSLSSLWQTPLPAEPSYRPRITFRNASQPACPWTGFRQVNEAMPFPPGTFRRTYILSWAGDYCKMTCYEMPQLHLMAACFLCVHMLCSCMCEHACMCMNMHFKVRQEACVILRVLYELGGQGFSSAWSSLNGLHPLTREPQGSSRLHFPKVGVASRGQLC